MTLTQMLTVEMHREKGGRNDWEENYGQDEDKNLIQ